MVLLVPMPTFLLDFLLVINLTISAIVLVSVMFVKTPLDLSVFPHCSWAQHCCGWC